MKNRIFNTLSNFGADIGNLNDQINGWGRRPRLWSVINRAASWLYVLGDRVQ